MMSQWPKEAQAPARFKDSDGKFVNVAKWIHGDGKISNEAAALLFTASGTQWFIDHIGITIVYPPSQCDNVWSVMKLGEGKLHSGPTLLHALHNAIIATKGTDNAK